MVAQIVSALSTGFSSRSIVNQLVKQFPQYAKQIRAAETAGFTADAILSHLMGSKNASTQGALTEYEQTKNRDTTRKNQITSSLVGTLGTTAAIGAGVYALSRRNNTPQANSLGPSAPIPPKPMNLSKRGTPNIPGGALPALENNSGLPVPITPTSNIALAPAPTRQKNVELVKNLKEDTRLQNLFSGGLTPEEVSEALPKIISKENYNAFKKAPGGVQQVVKDYSDHLQENPKEKDISLGEKIARATIPQKGEIIPTPSGNATIKGVDDQGVIAEINGKVERLTPDEVEPPSEDAIETVQRLLKIPESERSSIVSLFTYDPDEDKMYIQFHNGETYKYLGVDPEKVFKVAEKHGVPVSKGKSIFGEWSPEDKNSLGATLIKEIINDPKYRKPKKGEPPNPNYVKLETMYDYWKNLRKRPKPKKGL